MNLEDQWLPREHAHRHAGHIRSTLACIFRRAVPRPDQGMMSEDALPPPTKPIPFIRWFNKSPPSAQHDPPYLACGELRTNKHLLIIRNEVGRSSHAPSVGIVELLQLVRCAWTAGYFPRVLTSPRFPMGLLDQMHCANPYSQIIL